MVKIVFIATEIKSLNARVWLRWKPVDNWVSCVLWQRNALQSWDWVTLLEELFCSGGAASAIERRATQPETATLPCILNWTKSTSSGHFLTFAKTRKSPDVQICTFYLKRREEGRRPTERSEDVHWLFWK